MPRKHTSPSRDGQRCAFGHDWRVSFDGRFYYCYQCPAEWFMPDGSAPPQESYKQYPRYEDWTTTLPENTKQQGDSTTMPSKEFDAFLDNDEEQAGTKESWMKVRDMLYEPIRVTRANINTEDDKFNPGQTRTVAYVHFHFLDDEAETPFVFTSSARAIMGTIERAVRDNEFPFEAAVIEILSAEPFNGYFPLRFTSLGKLPEALAAYQASNGLIESAPAEPVATPPAQTHARAVSAPSKAHAAATAHSGSAVSTRPSRNLANRGN